MNNNASEYQQNDNDSPESPVVEGEIAYLTAGDSENVQDTPPPSKPSLINRIGHFFFSSETPVGRFLRTVIKWAIVILVSVFIGVIASYQYFYRPAAAELDSTQEKLQSTTEKISDVEEALQRTESELSSLETQHLQLQNELIEEQAYTVYFKALNSITAVQLELERNDELAANVAFKLTKENLEQLLPVVKEKNEELGDKLEKRVSVIFEEIDPANTKADLEQLKNNTLKELESLLFPQDK